VGDGDRPCADLCEHLAVHERAEPTLSDYDRLLVGVGS
jgi:hypothetical protein